MTLVITGFSTADKVPGFAGETVFGAGRVQLGTIPLTLLVVGLKSSSGSMVADSDILDCTSEDDANTKAGPGSELARMCYVALRIPGIRIKIAAPSAAGGAVAASGTITIAGSWSSSGEGKWWIGGELVSVALNSTHTTTTAAQAIRDAINANTKLPVTASSALGVVTITAKCASVRGNDYILHQDTSGLPSGMTSTLAGGASVTGGGVKLSGGSGTETMTTLLTALFPGRYHRIAFAQNDATSAAAWETQLDTKAGYAEGRMEHACLAHNGTSGAATTLGQTTLNNPRFSLAWLLNSESHPSEIAAAYAALRTQLEQDNPNRNYDGRVLDGIKPQRASADWASRATQVTCLDNSVTPLITTEDGTVAIVRAITTKSRNGSDADYRTLDVGQATTPDYVRDRLRLLWTTQVQPDNEYVTDDPSDGEPDPPAGVITPSRWNAMVTSELFAMQAERILTQVATNLPASEWNATAARIMTACPTVPLPLNHQVGVSVRQLNVA